MKILFLGAATLVLLACDLLIGISGTLYLGPVAGFAIIAFLIAVIVVVMIRQPFVLFALHNLALIYFILRNVTARYTQGILEFIMIAIAINLLVWLVVRLRSGVALSAL